MKTPRILTLLLCLLTASLTAVAGDYTTYLDAHGFTEVTSMEGITGNANDYYILASAENTGLIVGIGTYESKPDWASTDSKALHYRAVESDPILDLTNFFTIEKEGSYIGFRNVVYSADMFQTHDNAGYMYVNTFTDKDFDEWSYLIPSFQDGYWTFENGKYPMSSENWACGYLGPWHDDVVADDALALNKRDNAIGHYRLFKISKTNLETLRSQLQLFYPPLLAASASNPIDATWLIINPSFETGDETGWTMIGKDPNGNDEFKTLAYGMTNKEGQFLFNAYQWWAPNIGVTQTIDLPSGKYTLSGVVCTWADRIVYFTGNDVNVNTTGTGDATGIPVSLDVNIGINSKLTITAGSTGQWWADGHNGETQTFFKVDDVQLECKGLYLNGAAIPLPNDNTTVLDANQWYYYDVNYTTEYRLGGNLTDMVYSTDGLTLLPNITTASVTHEMTFGKGRVYFKTTRSDATLKVAAKKKINESESSFTAVALNVDGLPEKILGLVTVNSDGPQSAGTTKISQYLASKNYDFIGCSEDFNFHDELMSSLSNYSCGTHRASISGISYPFDTDGLNLIWKNATTNATNESWTRWGQTTSTDGNQYVKKGYRHYDMTLGTNGPVIDVFILHMDAGDGSVSSRESQWQQLAGAVNSADATRPKIIIGDTNSRWTRENITTNFMNRLNSNLTASDVWVEFYRNGIYPTTDMNDLTDGSDPTNYSNYEIVDKIIYINPTAANTVQLIPQSFRIEQDYIYDTIDHDGNTKALGDHKPVVVDFKYVKSGDEIPLGNVNKDGIISIADVTALVNIILGKDNTQPYQYDHDAADVNLDGIISIADVTALVNIILGK